MKAGVAFFAFAKSGNELNRKGNKIDRLIKLGVLFAHVKRPNDMWLCGIDGCTQTGHSDFKFKSEPSRWIFQVSNAWRHVSSVHAASV